MKKIIIGNFINTILHSELKYFDNEPRFVMYLDVINNLIKDNGNPIKFGHFKSETKHLTKFGFTLPYTLSHQLNYNGYMHPFILGNDVSIGTTNQQQFYKNIVPWLSNNGINLYSNNNPLSFNNCANFSTAINSLLKGKKFKADWAKWKYYAWFYGPSGDNMQII